MATKTPSKSSDKTASKASTKTADKTASKASTKSADKTASKASAKTADKAPSKASAKTADKTASKTPAKTADKTPDNQVIFAHDDGGWGVRKEGSDTTTAIYETRVEALERAREITGNQGGEVYIIYTGEEETA